MEEIKSDVIDNTNVDSSKAPEKEAPKAEKPAKVEATAKTEKPPKEVKAKQESEEVSTNKAEDFTKSTWKVINPFFHGEDEKRVKYELDEELPKDKFTQAELERFVSLNIIAKS